MTDQQGPSRFDLAQRTARIEEQLGHITQTLERIEQQVDEDQAELEQTVEEHDQKIGTMWRVYRLGRWAVPVTGTVLAGVGAIWGGL